MDGDSGGDTGDGSTDDGSSDGSGDTSGSDSGSSNSSGGGDPAAKIPDDEERAAEEALYNTLSEDDKLKRIVKLKESFRDLYDTINTIINAVNNIPKKASNLEKIQKTQVALNKLKEIIVDYISYNFDNRAYIDNYTNYIKFIAALRTVSDVISYINSDK